MSRTVSGATGAGVGDMTWLLRRPPEATAAAVGSVRDNRAGPTHVAKWKAGAH